MAIWGGVKCEKSRAKAVFCGLLGAVFHRETPRVSRVKRSVDQIEMGEDYSSIALRKSSSEGRTLRTSSADL